MTEPTIFISNLETIMTEKTEEKMNAEKPAENKQIKINKTVSFNAIKKMAFEIFFDKKTKRASNEEGEESVKYCKFQPVIIYYNKLQTKTRRVKLIVFHTQKQTTSSRLTLPSYINGHPDEIPESFYASGD